MAEYDIHSLLIKGAVQFKGHEYIFERKGDTFEGKSFDCFADDVHRVAATLLSKGLYGKKIIIFGANSYNYMVADIAVMGYVGVSCTVSKEWSSQDIINAAELLDAGAVIYSRRKESVVNLLKEKFPQILYIVMEELLQTAQSDLPVPNPLETDICCKIIFSSGTTGIPKAVMLSQDNMFANWESLKKRAPFSSKDKCYLFLPLSHTYGGICNFLYSLISGMSIYICSDTKLIMQEIAIVKPTVFCAVPLIYEKLYSACIANNLPPAAALGGNIRYLFSGGAYLKTEIRRFLKNAKLNLLEAYGLSETSSLISCEYSDPYDFESVGTVMETIDIQIRDIDENGIGEITVKGDNVSSGYFGNICATEKAFDSEGFFRTGDLGFLREGKLYVTERKRRMILLSNGENVFPDEIESIFMEYSQISHAKVYERCGKIFASLFVVCECDGEDIVAEVNSRLPKYAQVQAHEVIADSTEKRLK
ncbi:MAG: AMP-binding protein [Oscillospiraceae bacterium]|nr:AMP-binding protein [Oscillospiraceae bacterium]